MESVSAGPGRPRRTRDGAIAAFRTPDPSAARVRGGRAGDAEREREEDGGAGAGGAGINGGKDLGEADRQSQAAPQPLDENGTTQQLSTVRGFSFVR